jgi:pyruvate dehydrogenase E1 component alpha subunit
MNLAAVWKLPVVFLCENNGYAGRSAQAQTTSILHVADRAASYGVVGTIVDGQDVLAVHESVAVAVSRARSGGGPTLLEAKTYRYCDHSELDKGIEYRSQTEVNTCRARDPIELFHSRLRDMGELTQQEFETIKVGVQLEVAAAVTFARESPSPEPDALLDDLFA